MKKDKLKHYIREQGDKFLLNNEEYTILGFTYFKGGSKTRTGAWSLSEARKGSRKRDIPKIKVVTECGKILYCKQLNWI